MLTPCSMISDILQHCEITFKAARSTTRTFQPFAGFTALSTCDTTSRRGADEEREQGYGVRARPASRGGTADTLPTPLIICLLHPPTHPSTQPFPPSRGRASRTSHAGCNLACSHDPAGQGGARRPAGDGYDDKFAARPPASSRWLPRGTQAESPR